MKKYQLGGHWTGNGLGNTNFHHEMEESAFGEFYSVAEVDAKILELSDTITQMESGHVTIDFIELKRHLLKIIGENK